MNFDANLKKKFELSYNIAMRRFSKFSAFAVFALCVVVFAAEGRSGDFNAGIEAYLKGDFATAKQLWEPLAEGGDGKAQILLGHLYRGGRNYYDGQFARDEALAEEWYRRAAALGYAEAQYLLGEISSSKALRNDENAETLRNEAETWMEKAAKQGHIGAQNTLGRWYLWRKNSDKRDLGFGWLKAAANNGSVEAKITLFLFFERGSNVDPEKAAYWAQQAAEHVYPFAFFTLGNLYSTGKGLKRNKVKAFVWYHLAVENGYDRARQLRDRLESKLSASELAEANSQVTRCIQQDYKNC